VSSRYTADGRRRSSMTHASRRHTCELSGCDWTGFGNGAETSHGRAHVRRGEAVELVREYAMVGVAPSRAFLPPGDPRIAEYLSRGFYEEGK
jgi:hypothetical protein